MTGSLERGIPVSYMPRPVFALSKARLGGKIPERSEDDFSCQPARKGRLACDKAKAIFAGKNQEYLRMDT